MFFSKCKNCVGVMVFGQKAYDNIIPWLRTHYSQKFLIQNMFLSHPQNIQWRYLLVHAQNYIETFRASWHFLGWIFRHLMDTCNSVFL